MAHRGRVKRVVEYGSDDDTSLYEEYAPTTASRRSASKLRVRIDDERMRSPNRRPARAYHHVSYQAPSAEPENIIIENTLNVPQQYRPRASSTGAAPAPNYLQPIFVQGPPREHSRERIKNYHHCGRHESDEYSDDGSSYWSSRHRTHSRRRSNHHGDEHLSLELANRLKMLELRDYQERKESLTPATAEKLARLKALEEKRGREEEEAAILARIEDRKQKDKLREEALLLEYKEKRRLEDAEEKAAIERAEIKRQRKEAELKVERDRLLAIEKEKTANEKAERLRIVAEAKAKAAEEEAEAKAERERIILEEEARKKKEKEKNEELRLRILTEEEDRKKKEKAKAKAEEEEFQQKVKERFMKAGYSPDYIEDILEEKKKALVRRSSRGAENQLAIDVSRPTYIRVQLRHLYPETLDYYSLPWAYDPQDDRYILIKEYISHEFQQELFEHTKKLKLRREKLLITDGYVKESNVIIKPRNGLRDGKTDEMFLVRKKSTSKSPARRSWMFT